jgi:hypothetical protein
MMTIPAPSRPFVEGYGIPEDEDGLLTWAHVNQRMTESRNYWIGTVEPNGRPHAVPVWGVWSEDTLYFGGGPDTRWSRNLAANPEVAVHLESGDDVVILEGSVTRITDAEALTPIDDLYEVKYDMRHGPPIWVLRPRVVFAWTQFPKTTTRWVFEQR